MDKDLPGAYTSFCPPPWPPPGSFSGPWCSCWVYGNWKQNYISSNFDTWGGGWDWLSVISLNGADLAEMFPFMPSCVSLPVSGQPCVGVMLTPILHHVCSSSVIAEFLLTSYSWAGKQHPHPPRRQEGHYDHLQCSSQTKDGQWGFPMEICICKIQLLQRNRL